MIGSAGRIADRRVVTVATSFIAISGGASKIGSGSGHCVSLLAFSLFYNSYPFQVCTSSLSTTSFILIHNQSD
ncbi:hypothetical protein TIFTF001_003064 [Ficus carica]|uniref:Uncharacterized protein n=1 Tax=Ficus carica TaxID=3494 RepID=A0AA87Z7I1_FICCA|nr:hypothetical protein TIFTF001_003064 [Ficus carica]